VQAARRAAAAGWPCLAVILAVPLLAACQGQEPAAAARPPAPVEVGVITVGTADAPIELVLPGRLSASRSAEIRPQVSGLVQQRLFTEGAQVAAGQPLYQIDAASFEAERARSAAALQKAQSQREAAQRRATRDDELLRADAVSREVAEDSTAALREAEADVALARATLEAAQVQLGRTRIVAPISGRIEVSTVSVGALVTAQQAQALTTIRQIDPMHVDIVQSSAELLALRRQLGTGTSGSRTLRLSLEDGTPHPEPATLQVSGITVDAGTGAVTLRAVVPNPRGTLLPGMVVQARLVAGVERNAILVPQQGVNRSATGQASALVVGAGNRATLRQLELGRAVGNQWVVRNGLQAGDKLIVEGLQRVRPGQAVTTVAAQDPGLAAGAAAGAPRASAASAAPPSAAPPVAAASPAAAASPPAPAPAATAPAAAASR
jgi:membrane fusion protein (multidrug efflux system)